MAVNEQRVIEIIWSLQILRVTYNFETFIIYQFYFLVISGNIQELKNLEFDLYIFSLSRLCAIIVFPSLYIFSKIIFPIIYETTPWEAWRISKESERKKSFKGVRFFFVGAQIGQTFTTFTIAISRVPRTKVETSPHERLTTPI